MKDNNRKLTVLKQSREALNITQQELSQILQVTPQYVSALERGLNELTYYDAYRISKYLGKKPDDIFYLDAKKRFESEIEKWEVKDKIRQQQRKEEFEKLFK